MNEFGKMIIVWSLFVYDKQLVKNRNDQFLPPNRWSDCMIREEKQTPAICNT